VNERGQYGNDRVVPRTMIGLSPEALKEDLERLNGEVRSLRDKINAQRTEAMLVRVPGQQRQSPLEVFVRNRWEPFLRSWHHYYDDLKSASDASWRASTKIIESALSDWQSKLTDVRVDFDVSLAGLNGAGPSQVSAPAPAPIPAPGSAPAPDLELAPAPQAVDQASPSDKEKSSNVGLYVALGLGAVAVAAAVIAFRHTEAA